MVQSIVLSAIKTEVSLESDDPAYQNFLFQQYEERIEKLSQQDKLSKFCLDARFLSVVENGQYFMTKDTAEFSQFRAVACREYTLPRDERASQPKGWIQGNTKIGPVLEVATCCLHGKHGVEIRIMSLSRDDTHSWVRISHGSNKFVMNLNNNDTEIPEDQLEEYALQLNAKDFACRSMATAKPQRREPAGSSPRIIPIERRNWIDIEPRKYSLSEYEVSKKVIHLLRHSQRVHREEYGAVHFWRIKENLQSQFSQIPHWSDNRWKECLAAGGGAKRRYQYCTDISGTIFYPRALQGHSGRNLIDPSLQDNVVIPSKLFQYVDHIGCAFNLHSLINNGSIPGSQNSSKRQTVFFLPVDPMDKSHKDPDDIDLNVPRHAQYLHNAWKRHQDAIYWVDINLAIKEKIADSIERNYSSRNTSSFKYIYHVGCAIDLHSIINLGLILGGQNLSNRQTVFFLPEDPMDRNHKDPDTIDLNEPRHAQYMHKAWKRHQNTEHWVDINLTLRKGLKFYQTRSNAIILHGTLPAYCIPKVFRMETGEVIYEKVYMSPRPPPKISLKHEWKRELGSEVARQPEGEVARQPEKFPTNPTNSKSNS